MQSFKYEKFPNPLWRRENFQLLDGLWDFTFSDSLDMPNYDQKILVPYTYETKASLIGDERMHQSIWYHKEIDVDDFNYDLVFLGSDYKTILYINGVEVGSHTGAYTTFRFALKNYLKLGKNQIDIHILDSYAKDQLRGKQRTRGENYDCWYVQTTGIYKSLYLEKVGDIHFTKALFNGDKNGILNYQIEVNKFIPFKIEISFKNEIVKIINISDKNDLCGQAKFENFALWNIYEPNLYQVKLIIPNEDVIETYFGFRTIETRGNQIYLNDLPIYEKLVLQQGYYNEYGLSIPSVEKLKEDVNLIKEMGFNGFRMHQKIEDPHCAYFADTLGLLMWVEMPSFYELTERSMLEFKRDLPIILDQTNNSPCVVTIVLFNESWGIPAVRYDEATQHFIEEVYHYAKNHNPYRLYIANDGWHQLSCTDILSLHEYEQVASVFAKEYQELCYVVKDKIINTYGKAMADGHEYCGQPIIISEFGGISNVKEGWGYGDKAKDDADYLKRFVELFNAIYNLNYLSGFCYTQLSDVQQETNGLVDEARGRRLTIETIKKIVGNE